MTLEFSLDRVSKKAQTSNSIKIRPVGAELFLADERTDGRTDRHYKTNSRFPYFYERAKKKHLKSSAIFYMQGI
jgi:hypothetical protein